MKQIILYLEGFFIAFRSLKANRLRTSLTMLGIAIGIFAITIIFTLVNSLNYNLTRNLNKLGSSMLIVHHFPWSGESFENWQKYIYRPRVSYTEYLRLKKNLVEVNGVALEAKVRDQVKYEENAVSRVSVSCVTEDFIPLKELDMDEGRPFTEMEVNSARPVCVLGFGVAERLFGPFSGLGRSVRIKGKSVRVIGILEKNGADAFGSNPDEAVYVPYTYATRLYNLDSDSRDRSIFVKASTTGVTDQVESQIVGLMRSARGLRPKTANDFAINRPEMLVNVFENITVYLWLGGLFISFFAVVVGGFGIGNIMFTTVKERTFEIGLQKALGAKSPFILFQFLMESVLLCLLGGLVGLLLNFGVTLLAQAVLDSMEVNFEMVISTGSIVFGVLLSLAIGLASGLIPSFIASRMDPVESMRA